MSTELVTIQENNTQLAERPSGGFFGGNSRFFQVKPSNVELQQKTSRGDGSLEGKFRNGLTGEQYDEIHGVMIFEPTEPRAMYANQNEFGVPPVCFSVIGDAPHPNAATKQALSCKNCRHSSWDRWYKNRTSENLPKCKQHMRAFMVDRKSKIPFYLNIRGKSIAEATKACGQMTSKAELFLSEHGRYPEIYDFSFKITSKRIVDGKGVYYVMMFSDVASIDSEEERAKFGALYQRFYAQQKSGELRDDAEVAGAELEDALTEEDNSASTFTGKTIDAVQTQETVTI